MAVHNRFSLYRYSLGSEDNRIESEQQFDAYLGSVSGPTIKIPATEYFSATISGSGRGTISVPSEIQFNDSLSVEVSGNANVIINATFQDDLKSSLWVSKDFHIFIDFFVELQNIANAAKVMQCADSMQTALNASVHASKDLGQRQSFFDSLSAATGAIRQKTESLTVTIEIPPGAELRIDSENYTMLLNGENVLYAQSGAWINVSHDLIRLDIESIDGGDMSGALVYTERYL